MGLPLRSMTRKLCIWNRSSTLMRRVMARAGAGPGPMNGLGIVAGTGTSGGNGGVYAADGSSYLLALFFVFFVTVMLTTQLVMVRNQVSNEGNSHPPALRLMRTMRTAGAERREETLAVAGLGRALSALSSSPQQQQDGLPNRNRMRPTTTRGRWSQQWSGHVQTGTSGQPNADPQWMHLLWRCFRQLDGGGMCPWQPVIEASEKFYVYSAYLDDYRVNDPVVRIIGVARNKKSNQVWCHLGFPLSNGTTRWWRVAASVRPIREHWNLRYSAVFILCSLKGVPAVVGVPHVVSVSVMASSVMPQWQLPTVAPDSFMSQSQFNESYRRWLYTPTGNLLPLTHRNRSISRDPDDRSVSFFLSITFFTTLTIFCFFHCFYYNWSWHSAIRHFSFALHPISVISIDY